MVDLGCGPAEITCELAARRPDLRFLGVDHSSEAIDRARGNAARLGLTNARFEVGDVEAYVPQEPVGLVVLFDSFHHLGDPGGLVRRLGRYTAHALLVEPRGDWAGGWRKVFDFDWLVADLDNIRRHVDFLCGEEPPGTGARLQDAPVGPGPTTEGSPVERRYTLDDLERLFDGWRLDVRGTVAGFETIRPARTRRVDRARRSGGSGTSACGPSTRPSIGRTAICWPSTG